MCAEIKPKKVRKKAKPSAMTRPSKRGKKKRKVHRLPEPPPSGSDVQADQLEPFGEFRVSVTECLSRTLCVALV
jgi:hypothetical protein